MRQRIDRARQAKDYPRSLESPLFDAYSLSQRYRTWVEPLRIVAQLVWEMGGPEHAHRGGYAERLASLMPHQLSAVIEPVRIHLGRVVVAQGAANAQSDAELALDHVKSLTEQRNLDIHELAAVTEIMGDVLLAGRRRKDAVTQYEESLRSRDAHDSLPVHAQRCRFKAGVAMLAATAHDVEYMASSAVIAFEEGLQQGRTIGEDGPH